MAGGATSVGGAAGGQHPDSEPVWYSGRVSRGVHSGTSAVVQIDSRRWSAPACRRSRGPTIAEERQVYFTGSTTM